MCKNEDANVSLQSWKETPAHTHARSTFPKEPTKVGQNQQQ